MDAEPFRCRRTDGKKWRCRLPVLPDQKYCERHVHRGRLCSRKLVELHQTFIKSNSAVSSLKTTPYLKSLTKTKVNVKNQSLKIEKHPMENAHRPLEFIFSTQGVLQYDNDLGCGASSNDYKCGQSERCRRTDGKKWRCKKDALPGLKYCVQHMHRGVKKMENDHKSNHSVGASYQLMIDNVNQSSDSRSSSDATTISM